MITYLEHHITDHCNLNCKGCSHFSPLADPWFEDIEHFQRDFVVLAAKTQGKVDCIRLMGGEPLLHPEYDKFLRNTRLMFPYTNIQIVTNGLLLNKEHDKLIDVCNNYDIQVCVSNYGLNLDLKQLLKDFKYTRIDGKNSLYNICLNLNGDYDENVAFNNCDLHINRWYYFQGGRFYPCCVGANILYFNHEFKKDLPFKKEDLSISIYDHSIQEVLDFLNKPIPLCKYCNTKMRPHTYRPFEKTKKEIQEWTCQ